MLIFRHPPYDRRMQLLVIFSRRSWAELAAVCRWGRIRMTWGQPPASTPCCCSSRARGCPTQAPGLHTWAEIDVCKWSPLTWTRGIGYLSAWMGIWTQDCRKVASVLQFLYSISFPPILLTVRGGGTRNHSGHSCISNLPTPFKGESTSSTS